MMRKIFMFLCVFVMSVVSYVFAADYQDVLYLKNGSIIKGVIIEQIPDVSIKIETRDGSVFVYSYKDVKKIAKEKIQGRSKNTASDEVEIPEPDGAFVVNLLGLVQFGPQFELEKRLAKNTYMVFEVRLHSLGLLSYVIDDETQPLSIAAGIGLRYFLRMEGSNGAVYLGWHEQPGYLTFADSDDEAYVIFIANMGEIGYRWRFDGGFLLNVGATGGFAVELVDNWWYKEDPTTIYEGQKLIYFIGMAQVSFGWEF